MGWLDGRGIPSLGFCSRDVPGENHAVRVLHHGDMPPFWGAETVLWRQTALGTLTPVKTLSRRERGRGRGP